VLYVSASSVVATNRVLGAALANELGQNVLVVVPKSRRLARKTVSADSHREGAGFEVVALDYRERHPRASYWSGLGRTIDSFRPDVLLSEQDPAGAEGVQLKLAARRRQIPIVFCTCENFERDYRADAKRELAGRHLARAALASSLDLFLRWAYRWDNIGMWSMNKGGVRIAKELRGFRGPIVVAPLGVDEKSFTPKRDEARRAALGLREFTFGQFGRLTREKGIFHLFEAARRLKHHRFQILLDSMEEHDDPAFVEEVRSTAKEFGIADRIVTFTASHAEMPSYYNVIDCLVAPSYPTATYSEQYGRVVAEAMACGVPVLVSDCGHYPDLVGDYGAVFPAQDVDALREGMERVLSNPETARARAGEAVEYFREHLSSRAHAKIVLDLFWKLLDDPQRRSNR
jgi:glycosyltransferase involved in cell wall biosynthesis